MPVPYQGLAGPYNFRTRLDVFFVQDGQIFTYRPPATLSAPQIITTNVGSTVTNIPSRPVTIYLPRGYTQNTWKKYPVLYFHDGQNVFFPGGSFGTWDADRIANHEISHSQRQRLRVRPPLRVPPRWRHHHQLCGPRPELHRPGLALSQVDIGQPHPHAGS
ncbi:MAG: hypothetical protein EBT95_03425 [Verrucomicrobia bacterium]|nr:hypothetical protein [Verrucomicrobiota bacterium]